MTDEEFNALPPEVQKARDTANKIIAFLLFFLLNPISLLIWVAVANEYKQQEAERTTGTYASLKIGDCIIVTADMLLKGNNLIGEATVVRKQEAEDRFIKGYLIWYSIDNYIYEPFFVYNTDKYLPCK